MHAVLEEGFVDLNGTKYAPKVLRIGAADSSKISQHSHGVFVDKVIDGLLAMEQRQREDELSKISAFLQDLTRSIASLKSRLVHGSADARRTAASQLSRELHRREKYLLRMEILECAGGAGTESQGGQKERLEVLLMKDAEIVFTTLSSSGRTIVSRSGLQFRTVLVDEACQASEPATLQALAMACEHW